MLNKLKTKWNAWVQSIKGRVWSAWAKAAGNRAVKTMAQTMIANITTTAAMSRGDWLAAFSASALSGLASLFTSLIGLPEEVESKLGTRSWLTSAFFRCAKTIGQSVVSSLGAFSLFSEVYWPAVLSTALIAGGVSILTSIATDLPEASKNA